VTKGITAVREQADGGFHSRIIEKRMAAAKSVRAI
jgi:hypothetical protein